MIKWKCIVSKVCVVILKLCPRKTLCSGFITQLDSSMPQKWLIQVLFFTLAKALDYKKWLLKSLSYWSSQNIGAKIRNWEEFKSFSYPVSDPFLSLHYFSCQILSTSSLWNFLCQSSGQQPTIFYPDSCRLHCSSQFIVLSLSSNWSQVWRWLLESMIKDQCYDFPFKESLFSILCMRDDVRLSWKLKHLKYTIGTGWFFYGFIL